MIKYPSGVKAQTIKKKHEKKQGVELSISASNRGMNLENDINLSNEYYRDHDICVITKRPTPVNIVKVDYSHGAFYSRESQSSQKGRFTDNLHVNY